MKNSFESLKSQGYVILQGQGIKNGSWSEILNNQQTNFKEFHKSWDNLPADNFLSDGGHYRFRRYSVFKYSEEGWLELLPHEPHFQSTYRNNMNGGIHREYEAFEKKTIENPLLKQLVKFVVESVSSFSKKEWRIQAHQFRIQAKVDEAGQPTPEGIHRDGADFILIMLLNRKNIVGGVNHIYDDAKRLVFGGILETAGDAVLLDDRKVWHGVSEVYPEKKREPAHRDVLVLTFHNEVEA